MRSTERSPKNFHSKAPFELLKHAKSGQRVAAVLEAPPKSFQLGFSILLAAQLGPGSSACSRVIDLTVIMNAADLLFAVTSLIVSRLGGFITSRSDNFKSIFTGTRTLRRRKSYSPPENEHTPPPTTTMYKPRKHEFNQNV